MATWIDVGRYLAGVGTLAISLFALWLIDAAVGFLGDVRLGVFLGGLAVIGIPGAVGLALRQWWGPVITGVQAGALLLLLAPHAVTWILVGLGTAVALAIGLLGSHLRAGRFGAE
jgi:hypothetical protein